MTACLSVSIKVHSHLVPTTPADKNQHDYIYLVETFLIASSRRLNITLSYPAFGHDSFIHLSIGHNLRKTTQNGWPTL